MKRGRKSGASLEVVKPGGIAAIERPDPPKELTGEQAHEWRSVVDSLPADWFPREIHALLIAFCRHVIAGRRIAAIIETLLADDGDWLNTYDQLLRMQERESRAMTSLATKLRMTNQARMRPEMAARKINNLPKHPPPHKPPWETPK